jgi:hypothetical protein
MAARHGFTALSICLALPLACASSGQKAARPRAAAVAPAPSAAPKAEAERSPPAKAAAAPPEEEPGDGRVAVTVEWPEGTQSLELKDIAHVLREPADGARYIGKVMRGTRVAWKRVVAPDPPDPKKHRRKKPCPTWVEIAPRGFLCTDLLEPSPEPPAGTRQPVVRPGRLVPDEYYKVSADETKVYKSEDDVRADVVDKEISTKVMLVGQGTIDIDGTSYQKTDHGLVEEAALAKFWPSDYEGIVLAQHPAVVWPLAFVFFERGARKPSIVAAPEEGAERLRSATRRELVRILEERDGFVRIADGEWLDRKYIRVAVVSSPPADVGDSDQWIDVDLDEQVLVAYQGKTPVFVTLISTGGKKHPTRTATYHVRAKAATTPMAGDPSVPNRYEVSAVPWAVRFANGLFIHGVYWHDGFGGARSHGCVNVSPKDAKWVYEWVRPEVPDGWSEVEVPGGEGAIVRIHDHAHPEPPPFDYTKEEPWNVVK